MRSLLLHMLTVSFRACHSLMIHLSDLPDFSMFGKKQPVINPTPSWKPHLLSVNEPDASSSTMLQTLSPYQSTIFLQGRRAGKPLEGRNPQLHVPPSVRLAWKHMFYR